MWTGRKTAVVELNHSVTTLLPLDRDRRYDTALRIDGLSVPCQRFASPLGDELWREIVETIRECTDARSKKLRRRAEEVADAGNRLFHALCDLSPLLAHFLAEDGARRLVIATSRAEIQALPWEALTDDSLKSLALTDLSIVRCGRSFDADPLKAGPLLRIVSTFGPDTNRDVLAAVKSVGISNLDGRPVGIEITDDESSEVVNLVAHGDPDFGETLLADGTTVDAKQLADRFRDRTMVLMWSCYSAMVHSWGESPAMGLHAAGNIFVLGFAAPLHMDESAAVAQKFFQAVFGPAGSQDPETEIAAVRRSQFEGDFEFCDWASMVLWLRRPLDFSDLPLGRLRLPAAHWTNEEVDAVPRELRDAVDKDAALGDLRVLAPIRVPRQLPSSLMREWRGAVVHLVGHEGLRDAGLFKALGVTTSDIRKPHLADQFLSLLDALSTFRYAFLLWTDASEADALLVRTLERIPRNVAIVMASPYEISSQWFANDPNGTREGRQPFPEGESGFVRRVMSDRFREALATGPSGEGSVNAEFWNCRYFAAIKTDNWTEARNVITRLTTIEPLEADLLRGNLTSRTESRKTARELYQSVLERARDGLKFRELARAQQELGWVAQEMGDRGLAEQMYRSAIDILQTRVPDDDRDDSRWASALGRALRDYADLLADDSREEALPLLKRATAIHAMEGRVTQVAYCLVTRSKLMLRLERFDAAELHAQQAAIIFHQNGNDDGWVSAVTLAARAACARNRYAEARAILNRAIARLGNKDKPALVGRLELEAAEAALAAGDLGQAHDLAKNAVARLPMDLQRERAAAQKLQQFAETLK